MGKMSLVPRGWLCRKKRAMLNRVNWNPLAPVLSGIAKSGVVSQLNQIHQMIPELSIIPAHGRSEYMLFFPSGPGTCVGSH